MNDKYARMTGVWLCIVLILLAVVSRLLPHPPNFTPLAAVGLFSGAYLQVRKFWLIPVAALLLSDMIIGFYPPIVMVLVYVAFTLCTFIGRKFLRDQRSIPTLAASTLSGAVIFFVLSNLGDWLSGLNYPMTLDGFIDCYVLAIPFFRNTLLGDLFYVACLFGIYEVFNRILWNFRTVRST